jgi:hypothetical protein
VNARSDKRDLAWAALIAASFLFGLAVSWQRWGSPLIDCGREMNQPLRLMSGELLYSGVRHLYGPLSPYLHATAYYLFGPSLAVLYADGIVSAAIVLTLVYWLGRQVLAPLAAGAATLSVMWLCVFKPSGNFILPYSYNALHGTVLGLTTVALLVHALRRAPNKGGRSDALLLAAGCTTGLTMLAKTEMGLAALAAGVAAAVVSAYPDLRRGTLRVVVVVAPAAAVTVGVYWYLSALVGWSALTGDNFLLLYNVPPELAHYNQWISGFDHPLRSVGRMLIAAAKLGALAAIIAALGQLTGGPRGNEAALPRASGASGAALIVASPARVLASAILLLLVMASTTGLDWDKGPYLAMPLLLAALLWALLARLGRGPDVDVGLRTRILFVFAVYAMASLGRMLLHVRSGGAYGSYLVPMSVVLFTYLWAEPFPDWLERAGGRRVAGTVAVWLILLDAVVTAGILTHRYRSRYQVAITTERGTMVAERDVGQAWNEALQFIEGHTAAGDAVSVMPEGTSLDFLSGRRNPLREEITTPGFLDGPAEARAIARLEDSRTPLILITNRPTGEFGSKVFGRDYSVSLMRWIEAAYDMCAMFGPVKDPNLHVGDRPFFIKAYCRRPR